jgi:hypothetical protein
VDSAAVDSVAAKMEGVASVVVDSVAAPDES